MKLFIALGIVSLCLIVISAPVSFKIWAGVAIFIIVKMLADIVVEAFFDRL